MRELVTIKPITAIKPIEGADRIVGYEIDNGWIVVDQKDAYNIGDMVVFLEIDSWVPTEMAPFLSKGKEPRVYNGIRGEKLRTVKLRGQVSQGLILPLSNFPLLENVPEDTDLAELLGVTKWEAPIPACLSGRVRGNFPSKIRKTDQERCQNLWNKIPRNLDYEVTVKIDGSSMTAYYDVNSDKEDKFGVCSRNLDLFETEGNSFWDMANKLNLREKMVAYGRNIAIQGELWGRGINGNWEGCPEHHFNVFDIWDIDNQCYLGSEERMKVVSDLGLEHTPVLCIRKFDFETLQEALDWTEGPSIINPIREGTVWKSVDGTFSFKIISNRFLIKKGD